MGKGNKATLKIHSQHCYKIEILDAVALMEILSKYDVKNKRFN